jgi:IPT/TIG domain
MPVIDSRGRVFGRFNIVDAALAGVLLILIPAAYGSYLLFRDPLPTLVSVQPPSLPQGPGWQVEVRGQHFRPYLRVTFNDTQGKTFLFVNPTTAVVPLPDLAPGKYDVILYDYMREVARMPGAFTVEPPMTAHVEIDGVLQWLTTLQIDTIKPGFRFNEAGTPVEFLSVQRAQPAMLQVSVGPQAPIVIPAANKEQEIPVRVATVCTLQTASDGSARCAIGGVALQPGVTVRFPGSTMTLILRVKEIVTVRP